MIAKPIDKTLISEAGDAAGDGNKHLSDKARQSHFRSVGADGTHWLFVFRPDDRWEIIGDGERIAVGTVDRASINSGVRKFLSFTVAGGPEPGAACA